jgi:ubiquinol-cytochrome c reductase cytochrome b subunit
MNGLIKFGDATYRWLDERLGLTGINRATVLHYVPKSVNWWYVFGAAVLTAFTMQLVTGIFLAFTYVPSPDHAYSSLDYISHHQFAGNLLRGLHYWGASAMVLLIFIHMSAHFLTGSYKYPRELQWLTGAVLLILTLLMAFTGQLLRWNQDAYWARSKRLGRRSSDSGWPSSL